MIPPSVMFYFSEEVAKLSSAPSIPFTKATPTGKMPQTPSTPTTKLVASPASNMQSMANKMTAGVAKQTGTSGAVASNIPSATPALTGPTPPVTTT